MESLPDAAQEVHETRRAILRAAHNLFGESGFRAVSTRQIAKACGLTQPALYRHFATKQDLYVAVLREALQGLHTQLLAIVVRDEDVLERLRRVTHILPVTWEDASQMFHDISHELDDDRREQIATQFADEVVAPIASLFRLGIEQRRFRSPEQGGLDAIEATFALFRLLDAYDSKRSSFHSPRQRAEQMLGVLAHGLLAPLDEEAQE